MTRWATEWLPSNVKPSTAERYRCSIRQMASYFEHHRLDQLNRSVLNDYLNHRRLVPTLRGATVTNKTLKRDMMALSSVLQYALVLGWVERNVVKDLPSMLLKMQNKVIVLPTHAQIAEFADKIADQPVVRSLVLFLAYTGVRQEEAVGLERSAFNVSTRIVTLHETKTNAPRAILLEDRAYAIAVAQPVRSDTPYLFARPGRGAYLSFSNLFARLADKHGFKNTCHDLRHWFAVDWLERGGDIYRLSRHLGHSSVKTTEGYIQYTTRGLVGAVDGLVPA